MLKKISNQLSKLPCLINTLKNLIFLHLGIGEMYLEKIYYHGTKINTFHIIVDHAGQREVHLLLLIDLTS
jgi:hypothetical protein